MDGSESVSFSSLIIALIFTIICVIAIWKVFTKAGQPGWKSIVPFLNNYTLIKIAGKPGWWLLLLMVPLVNIIIYFIIATGIAKNFGKSSLYGIFLLGVFPIIGYLHLAFGNATYGNAQSPLPPQTIETPPTLS